MYILILFLISLQIHAKDYIRFSIDENQNLEAFICSQPYSSLKDNITSCKQRLHIPTQQVPVFFTEILPRKFKDLKAYYHRPNLMKQNFDRELDWTIARGIYMVTSAWFLTYLIHDSIKSKTFNKESYAFTVIGLLSWIYMVKIGSESLFEAKENLRLHTWFKEILSQKISLTEFCQIFNQKYGSTPVSKNGVERLLQEVQGEIDSLNESFEDKILGN